MRCPSCGAMETRVIETRTADEGRIVRRRRECPECSNRFTTYEKAEEKRTLRVIKKDGSRETFDRDKIIRGIGRACEKLPVSLEQIEDLASKIEDDLKGEGFGEVPVSEIGRRVMDGLRKVNQVAYVRFASVYREFKDVETFRKEIESILDTKNKKNNDSRS